MNIERLSPSSYNSWDDCQQKYFLEQNLKYRYPPGKAANIGTVVHRVLELLALIQLNSQSESPKDQLEFTKYTIDVSNYSILELIDYANNSAYTGNFDDKDHALVRKNTDFAIKYKDGRYDPRNRKIVMPEKRIEIPMEEEWAKLTNGKFFKLTGIIDLVSEIEDNTYEIVDWKTGASKDWVTGKVKGFEDFYQDPQLRFYHWACTEMYGLDKNYLLTIFFLKEKKKFSIPFLPEDIEQTKQIIRDRFLEVKETKIPALSRTWKCKKFCPFGKLNTAGTAFPLMIQEEYGGIASVGQDMTICDCAAHHIQKHGIDYVEQNFKKSSTK